MKAFPSNQPMEGRHTAGRLRKALTLAGAPLAASIATASHAFAQAQSTANTIGAQADTMWSELIDAGGTGLGAVSYIAAILVFVGGVWAFWQSRQPQNREGGYVARGVAALVLCGLFVMAPQWINKASHTVAGADATINNTPAQIKFAP